MNARRPYQHHSPTPAVLAGHARPGSFAVARPKRQGDHAQAEKIVRDDVMTWDPDGVMFVTVDTPHDGERAKVLVSRAAMGRAARGHRITDGSPR